MENITINPANYKSEYIKYLNQCFNGWGQEREYDWAFSRTVGDKKADIMLIHNEEGEVIAGSAVTYRKLSKPGGGTMDIAIMTGSWTLPKARGKGCFSKIISLSQELAHKKNVPYLTAFVTESNASYRRLASAGSMLVPNSNLFSPEQPYADADSAAIEVLQEDEKVISDIYSQFSDMEQEGFSFAYTREEFYQQYINRPKKVEILKINADYALVEETYNAIKVLLLSHDEMQAFEDNIKSLTNWAIENRSKKLLLFSTKSKIIEACEKLGFESLKGYYTILHTAADAGTEVDTQLMWVNIHSGDKM
ncbi:GNAT family N-acetyltransferase [Pontibacter toksunensis]|uniref:GNAT family N-acetyltransferase n=1 Tax=Pontibacter toksunensis TaxID=1332631 RepID=A0ABW6C1N7_9BACT